jgi:hypothetical protein
MEENHITETNNLWNGIFLLFLSLLNVECNPFSALKPKHNKGCQEGKWKNLLYCSTVVQLRRATVDCEIPKAFADGLMGTGVDCSLAFQEYNPSEFYLNAKGPFITKIVLLFVTVTQNFTSFFSKLYNAWWNGSESSSWIKQQEKDPKGRNVVSTWKESLYYFAPLHGGWLSFLSFSFVAL